MICAEDLALTLGGIPILRGLNFVLRPGSVTVILGANGAGKSSLLSLLAGDRAASCGELTWLSRPIAKWSPRILARHRAVVPQSTQLAFPFTVEEVVALGRLPHADPHDDSQALTAVRHRLALESLWHREFYSLSGGEQQRVHFARALAQLWYPTDNPPPRALLLDEPTAALDLKHQLLILEEASALARHEGVIVVAILHDLTLAARIADRLLLLHRGSLLRSGTVDQVFDDEVLSIAYDTPLKVLRHPETGNFLISAA